ncbi:hypothetical protein HYR99_17420 [Candidatus Poribacteria bacterium]|nr:hypothetical protein [Candidatus Poribacteria bacterium]
MKRIKIIPMPYDLIDKIIESEKVEREKNRVQVLADVREILSELGPKYGVTVASPL